MEKAKEFLQLSREEEETVSRVPVHPWPNQLGVLPSFFEQFSLRGIRVDRVEPGFVSCTFKVPPRLLDGDGNLARGAIINLIDEVGDAPIHVDGPVLNVSVDMSITFLASAKVDDELEITAKALGRRGSFGAGSVIVRNKATGEIIAEGRHSLFAKPLNKL